MENARSEMGTNDETGARAGSGSGERENEVLLSGIGRRELSGRVIGGR